MRLKLLGIRNRLRKVGGPWPKPVKNCNILTRGGGVLGPGLGGYMFSESKGYEGGVGSR